MGADLANGEITLPLLIAFERMDTAEKARLESLIKNWSPGNFGEVIVMLEKHNALAESRRIIHQYLASARQAAQILPASEGRDGLEGVVNYLAQQSDVLGV